MRIGRPIPTLSLTDDERETLKQWARRPKTSQALAQRARIILACAEGKSNTTVAARLGVIKQTVGKWRTRFLNKRLDGLLDEPRPGAACFAARAIWKQLFAITSISITKHQSRSFGPKLLTRF